MARSVASDRAAITSAAHTRSPTGDAFSDTDGPYRLRHRAQPPSRLGARAARARRAWTSASDSSRRPSVTAPTIPRLRAISSIIVSSIVSAASRYQAVTASSWPMRWQRSSAWSWIAGVHSRSRKATLEARVSVIPCAPTRVEQRISCGPSGSWNACTAASRAWPESRPSRCAASGKRSTSTSWTSRWPANTTSGSSEARKSSIQASAAPSLPRAASRLSALSCASRSARSAAATRRSSSERSSGCSRSQAITSFSASRYSRSLPSATGTTTWRLRGSCGQHVGLQAAHEAGAAQVPVDALLRAVALEAAREARAGAELAEPAEHAQLGDQLVGVVHHRRAGQREPQRALGQPLGEPPHRARALGARVLDVVRLVEHERARLGERQPGAVGVDDLVVEDRDLGERRRRAGAATPPSSERCGSQCSVSRRQLSFSDAGHTTTAG